MIRNERIECLILGHGLELPYLGDEGRGTSIGHLLNLVTKEYSDGNTDEVIDALHSLQPDHAELKQYENNGPKPLISHFDRNDPNWREFFNGYFNIRILPAGRRRFEMLSDQILDSDHRKFARMAIDEARKSVSESDGKPHPLVGAVVVKNGQVLSVAHRGEVDGNHAEFTALEKKLSDEAVAGATVYTTLEPCTIRNHPKIPCASRLIERKVTRVVIGMLDPDERITGRGWRKLRSAGIIVESFPPELVPEVEELNREFTRHCEQQTAPPVNVEEIQKRVDLTHVSARIDQGDSDFIVILANESDETVRVREICLLSEHGIRLTEPRLLKRQNTIEPRKFLSEGWRTQQNPADKLFSLHSAKGEFPKHVFSNDFVTDIEVNVTCEVLGKVMLCKTRLHVKVFPSNHRIEQIAG